jgi:prepilin-type N-terminal cleavage/methylation domain-containing protein
MTTRTDDRSEAGFSLIELMVALTITLIVSGAIYGLMAQGQGSFQREPQLTDRQQNIRIAMDLIETDVVNAGRGMPLVSQVFTDALDGGVGNPDTLEVLMANPRCQSQVVCSPAVPAGAGGAPVNYITQEPTASNGCLAPAGGTRPLALLADSRFFTLHTSAAGAGGVCGVAAPNGSLTLNAALPGHGPGFTSAGTGVITIYPAQLVRYELTAPDAQGIRDLRRSERGGLAPGDVAPGDWQVVARGIDDLQVRYTPARAGAAEADTPGVIPACTAAPCPVADYDPIIKSVRITLRARTIAANVQGPVGDHAVRGNLTTIVTPRAAATALEVAGNYN